MDFPAAIFPSPLCPHLMKRELFAEYGMLSAVNLNQDGTFLPQKRCTAMPSQVPAKAKLLIKHKPGTGEGYRYSNHILFHSNTFITLFLNNELFTKIG